MAKGLTLGNYMEKPKVKRKGVHSKTKQSKNKNSKNYKKPYVGQGKKH
jgi:hypothetical protein